MKFKIIRNLYSFFFIIYRDMSQIKELVINAIRNLPDDITYEDIMELVYIQKKDARGLSQIEKGESIPNDVVKKEIGDKIAANRNLK